MTLAVVVTEGGADLPRPSTQMSHQILEYVEVGGPPGSDLSVLTGKHLLHLCRWEDHNRCHPQVMEEYGVGFHQGELSHLVDTQVEEGMGEEVPRVCLHLGGIPLEGECHGPPCFEDREVHLLGIHGGLYPTDVTNKGRLSMTMVLQL